MIYFIEGCLGFKSMFFATDLYDRLMERGEMQRQHPPRNVLLPMTPRCLVRLFPPPRQWHARCERRTARNTWVGTGVYMHGNTKDDVVSSARVVLCRQMQKPRSRHLGSPPHLSDSYIGPIRVFEGRKLDEGESQRKLTLRAQTQSVFLQRTKRLPTL